MTGTSFAPGATVSFGGASATAVTFGDAASLSATAPAHVAGAFDVVVTNTDGQSAKLAGGYTYPATLRFLDEIAFEFPTRLTVIDLKQLDPAQKTAFIDALTDLKVDMSRIRFVNR